jgi:hypothetical protein
MKISKGFISRCMLFLVACLRFSHVIVNAYSSSSSLSIPHLYSNSNNNTQVVRNCDIFANVNVSVEVIFGTGSCNPGSNSGLISITDLFVPINGQIYLVDNLGSIVYCYDPTSGDLSPIIGTGLNGFSSQGGLANQVALFQPHGVVGDPLGEILYISDTYHIWKYNTTSGFLTRFAGSLLQLSLSSGDGGPATIALLNNPTGMFLSDDGILFFAESGSGKVRQIDSNGIISTVAGGGILGFGGDGLIAHLITVKLNMPTDVYLDSNGILYIADTLNNRVRFVNSDGLINTFAGGGLLTTDNVPATSYALTNIGSISGDNLGNIFIADVEGNRILRVGIDGFIMVIIGTGQPGITLGSAPLHSMITSPNTVFFDTLACALFEVEATICTVKRTVQPHPTVSPAMRPSCSPSPSPTGHSHHHSCSLTALIDDLYLEVVAGTGLIGYSGDNGLAVEAQFKSMYAIWADFLGDLFIVDNVDHRVRYIDGNTGIVKTVLGTGNSVFSNSGGFGNTVPLCSPWGIVGDPFHDLVFISDTYHIWQLNRTSGLASIFAGSLLEISASIGDGGPANLAVLDHPAGMWLTTDGTLYFAESGSGKVRYITSNGIINKCAGGGLIGFGGDGLLAIEIGVKLNNPTGVYVDPINGHIYVADCNNARIRIVVGGGIINTFAGGGLSLLEGSPATSYALSSVGDIRGDSLGNIFFSDSVLNKIFKIDTDGMITSFIGSGHSGINLGIVQASAAISSPLGLWVDLENCFLYAVESSSSLLKRSIVLNGKCDPSSFDIVDHTDLYLKVLAGNGHCNYSGDGLLASEAQLRNPISLFVDLLGNTFIVDLADNRVRCINGTTGIISTIIGTGNQDFDYSPGYGSDISLFSPYGIIGDLWGNHEILYISDKYHIWKYNRTCNIASVFAGTVLQISASTGDGGPATSALLDHPAGLWLCSDGRLFFAESKGNKIRMINTHGIISTVAGSGVIGFGGDGESCTSPNVKLHLPTGCYVDPQNDYLFIADQLNARIRIVINGIIDTYAGGGSQIVDGTLAKNFKFNSVGDCRGDHAGNLLVSDPISHKVYLINGFSGVVTTLIGSGNAGTNLGVSHSIASITSPLGLWIDLDNILYTAESLLGLVKQTVYVCPNVLPSPSEAPCPTASPTYVPTDPPTYTKKPSASPTKVPTTAPSKFPSAYPSAVPTYVPAAVPTAIPTTVPIDPPTVIHTDPPSTVLTASPTDRPAASPSVVTTVSPTAYPVTTPVASPVSTPYSSPVSNPTAPVSSPVTTPVASPVSSPVTTPVQNPVASPTVGAPFAPFGGGGGPGPTSQPTGQPSSQPSSQPTFQPSFMPSVVTASPVCHGRRCHDHIEIVGRLILKSCSCETMSNSSLAIILQVVTSISLNPQKCDLLTISKLLSTIKLQRFKSLIAPQSTTSNNFEVNFFDNYEMIYYPGFNVTHIAGLKTNAIRTAVESGTFQTLLRHFAQIQNVSELMNVSCNAVSLNTTIFAADDDSSSKKDDVSQLSIGAIAGISVGCFVASVLGFIFFIQYWNSKKENNEASSGVEEIPQEDDAEHGSSEHNDREEEKVEERVPEHV